MTEGRSGCNWRERLIHRQFISTVWRVSAYVVVSVDITDPEGYQSYLPGAGAAVQAHGGRLLAADPDTSVIEGSAGQMTVILEFPDKAAAEAWYSSPEYQGVVHLRHQSADGSAVIADGFVAPAA